MSALSPHMSLPTWWLAYAYFRENDYRKAKPLFEKTLRGVFSDWEAHVNLGLIEDRLGDQDAAIDHYHRALSINPEAAVAYNNLGVIFIKNEDDRTAEDYLLKAVRFDHYLINAKKNLANIYLRQGKNDLALQWTGEVLKIAPHDTFCRQKLEALKK